MNRVYKDQKNRCLNTFFVLNTKFMGDKKIIKFS